MSCPLCSCLISSLSYIHFRLQRRLSRGFHIQNLSQKIKVSIDWYNWETKYSFLFLDSLSILYNTHDLNSQLNLHQCSYFDASTTALLFVFLTSCWVCMLHKSDTWNTSDNGLYQFTRSFKVEYALHIYPVFPALALPSFWLHQFHHLFPP